MADNVAITAGSGTQIATDDVGGVHFQYVKLANGTADNSTPIPGNADGLYVQNNLATKTDDSAFSVASSKVTPAGFIVDEAPTDLLDEGDAGVARVTTDRRQIVAVGESGANLVNGYGSATGTGSTAIIAAQGAGVYLNISAIIVHNSSTTDTYVIISGGASNLVFPAPAKGGAALPFPTPYRCNANTALSFSSGGAVSTMYVSAVGYKSYA